MKPERLFSSPLTCGMLAGVAAGGLWAALIVHYMHNQPQSMGGYLFLNALRSGICLGVVLCGPALYLRKMALAFRAGGYAIVIFINALVLSYMLIFAGRAIALSAAPGFFTGVKGEQNLWVLHDVLSVLLLCPFFGLLCGGFMTRLYRIPELHRQAILFGMLGCGVHLLFGLAYSAARVVGLDTMSNEGMAMHAMLAILGYVFLGAMLALPFDRHFRRSAQAELH